MASNKVNGNDSLDIFIITTERSSVVITEVEVAASLARVKPNKVP